MLFRSHSEETVRENHMILLEPCAHFAKSFVGIVEYSVRKVLNVKVIPENVKELFSDYSIVCEAFDKPDQKAMLVRELLTQCPETTVVSGNGMAGYGDTNEIRTQQMMRRLYVCGDQSTDVGNGIGLVAPRVAACAAHEANKVLQLIMQTE